MHEAIWSWQGIKWLGEPWLCQYTSSFLINKMQFPDHHSIRKPQISILKCSCNCTGLNLSHFEWFLTANAGVTLQSYSWKLNRLLSCGLLTLRGDFGAICVNDWPRLILKASSSLKLKQLQLVREPFLVLIQLLFREIKCFLVKFFLDIYTTSITTH